MTATTHNYKQLIAESDARQFYNWMVNQGGLQVWESKNPANPDGVWFTPVLQSDTKTPTKKPSHQAGAEPDRVLTEPGDIGVVKQTEFTRIKVKLRSTGEGLMLTDATNQAVNQALRDAGQFANHAFDYENKLVVVYKAGDIVSLEDWVRENAAV